MSDHFENSLPLSNVIVDIHDLCKDDSHLQIASVTSSLFLLALSNTIYFEYFSTKVTIADFLAFPTIVSPSKWTYSILVLALGYFSSLS